MVLDILRIIIFVLFSFLLPRSALCSEQSCTLEVHQLLELTAQSISHFTTHLRGGPDDPFTAELRKCLLTNDCYLQLYIKYLIGSFGIFGRVDSVALVTIRDLCDAQGVRWLSGLLESLASEEDCDEIVKLAANYLDSNWCPDIVRDLVRDLMVKNWSLAEAFVVRVLGAIKDYKALYDSYRIMLSSVPTERQYELFNTGKLPLTTINFGYVLIFSNTLRELFALARCSYNPNPQIRSHIAREAETLEPFLADPTVEIIMPSCPDDIPELNADTWYHIFTFLDVETLTFVLPLVCTCWCKLYPKMLTHSAKIHDLYLENLRQIDLSLVHFVGPWKYCLVNRANALKYLGHCIVNGALGRIKSACSSLEDSMNEYLQAVIDGEAPLPRIKNRTFPYESFLGLFELICELCTHKRPALEKPRWLTDEEYEQAVHYFVYKKQWILKLSDSLMIDKMPRLFAIIQEDEKLMKELIALNFGNFETPSVILILHGQTSDMPERLATLIHAQTDLFRGLVEPKLVPPSEHYKFIFESNVLSELPMDGRGRVQFARLVISVLLFYKDSPDMIGKVVATAMSRLSSLDGKCLECVIVSLRARLSRLLEDIGKHSPSEIDLIEEIVSKLGQIDRPHV